MEKIHVMIQNFHQKYEWVYVDDTGLQQLQEHRLKHRKNPLIGYLNGK